MSGPGFFEKSSKPALVISTLEALAVLVALKVYYGEEPTTDRSSIRIVPTTTDNREERGGPQQADDHEISRERSFDGTRSVIEEDGIEGISGVVAPGSKS